LKFEAITKKTAKKILGETFCRILLKPKRLNFRIYGGNYCGQIYYQFQSMCTWGDSDVILSTVVTAAMLDVYYGAYVSPGFAHKLTYACKLLGVESHQSKYTRSANKNFRCPHFYQTLGSH